MSHHLHKLYYFVNNNYGVYVVYFYFFVFNKNNNNYVYNHFVYVYNYLKEPTSQQLHTSDGVKNNKKSL